MFWVFFYSDCSGTFLPRLHCTDVSQVPYTRRSISDFVLLLNRSFILRAVMHYYNCCSFIVSLVFGKAAPSLLIFSVIFLNFPESLLFAYSGFGWSLLTSWLRVVMLLVLRVPINVISLDLHLFKFLFYKDVKHLSLKLSHGSWCFRVLCSLNLHCF